MRRRYVPVLCWHNSLFAMLQNMDDAAARARAPSGPSPSARGLATRGQPGRPRRRAAARAPGCRRSARSPPRWRSPPPRSAPAGRCSPAPARSAPTAGAARPSPTTGAAGRRALPAGAGAPGRLRPRPVHRRPRRRRCCPAWQRALDTADDGRHARQLPRRPGAARAAATLLRADWPYDADELTVVDGAMDALDLVARSLLRFGDRVVVEHPCFPPLLDLLESIGAEVVGVPMDDEGLPPDALAAALAAAGRGGLPAAAGAEPHRRLADRRARAPSSRRCSPAPARPVVEDDSAGAISTAPDRQPRRWMPGADGARAQLLQVARARPAARGPERPDRAAARRARRARQLGQGWSSRLLQRILLGLLTDDDGRGRTWPGPRRSTPGGARRRRRPWPSHGVDVRRHRRAQHLGAGARRDRGGRAPGQPGHRRDARVAVRRAARRRRPHPGHRRGWSPRATRSSPPPWPPRPAPAAGANGPADRRPQGRRNGAVAGRDVAAVSAAGAAGPRA